MKLVPPTFHCATVCCYLNRLEKMCNTRFHIHSTWHISLSEPAPPLFYFCQWRRVWSTAFDLFVHHSQNLGDKDLSNCIWMVYLLFVWTPDIWKRMWLICRHPNLFVRFTNWKWQTFQPINRCERIKVIDLHRMTWRKVKCGLGHLGLQPEGRSETTL